MEFLRFGSSIPGAYWGCCAADVIQNFNVPPHAKASIQLVDGDGGIPVLNKDGKELFAGPTYKDIFLQRLRSGTFEKKSMPNHAFFAILSAHQLQSNTGKQWLGILHEQGFEFLRKVNNSVWDVTNYIFILVRNVGTGAVEDQFTPPAAWTSLGAPKVPEAWSFLPDTKALTKEVKKAQKGLYAALPKDAWLTEDELIADGVPVTMAGKRSRFPPQEKSYRKQLEAARTNKAQDVKGIKLSAFPAPSTQPCSLVTSITAAASLEATLPSAP